MDSRKAGAFLCAALLTFLAGCAGETSSSGGSESAVSSTVAPKPLPAVSYSEPGEFPIVADQIELVIFAPADGQNSRDDNALTLELEEKTGIDISWQIASAGAFKEKMDLMLVSGDMVDIIAAGPSAGNRVSKVEELELAAQGLIIPLEQLLDTVSVGYQAAFEAMPGLREYITTPEGHIYSLPNVDGSLHIQYNQKMWLNTVWLDNLGMAMPTTTEEFYEVLCAFRDQDANRNGDAADEIPLSTCRSGTGVELDGFLMAPFQLTPESKLYLEDGAVVFAPVTDGYREGLRYLYRLYAEGLIAPESFTQEREDQVERNEGGKSAVIGAFPAQRPGYACDLTVYPDNSWRWEQYQSVPPLTGPDGTCQAAWNPYAMYQTGAAVITGRCAYPEAAFRLIDYLATEEGTLRTLEGPEGLGWRWADEGEKGLDGNQALITQLDDAPDNSGWGQLMGVVRTPELAAGYTAPQKPYAPGVPPLVGRGIVLYRASLEHQAVAQPRESVLPELYYTETEYEELSILEDTILSFAKESLEAFVTGKRSIDKEWDSYLRQMNAIGLERYLEMVQSAYQLDTEHR